MYQLRHATYLLDMIIPGRILIEIGYHLKWQNTVIFIEPLVFNLKIGIPICKLFFNRIYTTRLISFMEDVEALHSIFRVGLYCREKFWI